jgi:hypothetical protein
MIRRTLIAALATLMLAGTANASLIQNGDFDVSNTGYGQGLYGNGFTPTVAQAPGWTFVNGSGILNNAWGGPGTMAFLQNYSPFAWADPSLSQTFSSSATGYKVTFDLRQRGGNQESVNVTLDGKSLAPTLTPVDYEWTSYSFDIAGLTGGSHTLSFNAINLSSAWDSTLFVDHVGVTATAFASDVPEPFSIALMLGGLGAMGWARRRRA